VDPGLTPGVGGGVSVGIEISAVALAGKMVETGDSAAGALALHAAKKRPPTTVPIPTVAR
jgi:hypothetical protein